MQASSIPSGDTPWCAAASGTQRPCRHFQNGVPSRMLRLGVVSSGTMSWVRRRFTRISCRRRALGAAMKVGGGCLAMVYLDLQDTIEDC